MVKEISLKIKGQRETFSKVGDYSGNFRRIRVDTRRNPKKNNTNHARVGMGIIRPTHTDVI